MTITATTLTRAAGLAAVAAGLLFIGVQIGHPHLDATSITTTEMAVRGSLKVAMGVLALIGISGMYLSQVRKNRLLGLVGYLILAAGYLLITSTTFLLATVLPSLVSTDPAYVAGALTAATGGVAASGIGTLQTVFKVQGLLYLAGGLLFGVALFRASVLSRWATALLAVGGLVSGVLAVMPDAFYRLLALPNGVALIALGYSLWRSVRTPHPEPAVPAVTVPADASGGSAATTAGVK